ncbi:MAG: hypothetical protein GWN56_14905 [Nitrosopumilaceae archaeon]|nr:hypothetical protein [Nitrosopumilaceae archaeon]NIV66857.1 hypothetical protein [Nitrosopumilaceae archaeon]
MAHNQICDTFLLTKKDYPLDGNAPMSQNQIFSELPQSICGAFGNNHSSSSAALLSPAVPSRKAPLSLPADQLTDQDFAGFLTEVIS